MSLLRKTVVRWGAHLLLAPLLLVACAPGTGSDAFRTPSIVSADAALAWKAATLRATLSTPRADRCGFLFENADGVWQTLPCVLVDCAFDAPVEGLEPGRTYRFLAYAEAGENRITTDTLRFTAREALPSDPIDVEDPAFKNWLLARYDRDGDGEISFSEAEAVRSIGIWPTNRYHLESLQGIEYMPNLETIDCWGDWDEDAQTPAGTLRFVDLSRNPRLTAVALSHNAALGERVPDLDLSGCPAMRFFDAVDCGIRRIDVSGCPALEDLSMYSNALTTLDLRSCPRLRLLSIADNRLTEIDVSENAALEDLAFNGNPLRGIDLSHNPRLWRICCWACGLESLDLSANPELQFLQANNNRLRTLDVSCNLKLGAPSDSDSGLWCSGQHDEEGRNLLETLYVAAGQEIPFVTVDRSEEHVPSETRIVVVPSTGE